MSNKMILDALEELEEALRLAENALEILKSLSQEQWQILSEREVE